MKEEGGERKIVLITATKRVMFKSRWLLFYFYHILAPCHTSGLNINGCVRIQM